MLPEAQEVVTPPHGHAENLLPDVANESLAHDANHVLGCERGAHTAVASHSLSASRSTSSPHHQMPQPLGGTKCGLLFPEAATACELQVGTQGVNHLFRRLFVVETASGSFSPWHFRKYRVPLSLEAWWFSRPLHVEALVFESGSAWTEFVLSFRFMFRALGSSWSLCCVVPSVW